jgi:hypothetical protein
LRLMIELRELLHAEVEIIHSRIMLAKLVWQPGTSNLKLKLFQAAVVLLWWKGLWVWLRTLIARV